MLEMIKKAFELVEISCSSAATDSTRSPREQLKAFMQEICYQIEHEQQTENQLEIQECMKEWNNERHWLLNHVCI